MYIGKSYKLSEFLLWTRRSILWLLIAGIVPTILYEVFDIKWISVPWAVVALLGTATAFVVGFKNQQTYNRTWEARQAWGAAMSASRAWTMMCRDFIDDQTMSKEVIYRHIAWLTALRYQLRAEKIWETTGKSYNKEYSRYYTVPERETPVETALSKYLSEEELEAVLSKHNIAAQLLSNQSAVLTNLTSNGTLEAFRFLEMHSALREFSNHQGKNERIKNFPYPRQYATINTFFVRLFCILLPFAMLKDFSELNNVVSGALKGHMVWFVVPFSALISWVYTSLDQVGESTENPFEGSANDVPITQMSHATEIDIREMLGELDLPAAFKPQNDIVL